MINYFSPQVSIYKLYFFSFNDITINMNRNMWLETFQL